MNILFAFIYLIVTFGITVFIYKIAGKEGMIIWICISIILSNIQSIKFVDIIGYTTVLGNIAYSNIFLATDILNEFEGKQVAKKSVFYGFFAMITFTILMLLAVAFIPSNIDTSQNSLSEIFMVIPRICVASMVSYLLSQLIDVIIYQKLKKKYNKLWISNNFSTITSQLFDTIVFVSVAYIGTMNFSSLIEIGLTMFVLKLIIAVSDTGFIYLSKHLQNKKGIQGEKNEL